MSDPSLRTLVERQLEVASLSGEVHAVMHAIVESMLELPLADGASLSTIAEGIAHFEVSLGADAPQSSDFVTVLPKGAVKTVTRIAALGEQLETLLVRVYLNGVGFAEDSATRLFLGRLLAYDAEQLAWLRGVSGHASPAGLLSPIDLGPAGDALDAFLSTPDFPD